MRQIKNFMTRDQIAEDLAAMSLKEESPAELEFQAQESFYSNDYEMALYYIDTVIDVNPSQFSFFKRAQIYLKLNEPDNALDDLDIALSINEDYANALDLKELILERVKRERDYTMDPYS
jgi:tetratricopeptide (TPR) repeat protein